MTIHPIRPRGLCLIVCLALWFAAPVAAWQQKPIVEETKPPVPQPAPAASAKPAPPAPEPAPAPPKGPFVRKFSMGGYFGFLTQASIPSARLTQDVTTEYSVESQTVSKRRPFGGGIVFQVTLTPRLALASGVSLRRLDFSNTDITYVGVDDPDTADDERTASMKENTTRAQLLDVPVLLRYYNKDHSRRGRRTFYEAGMTLRYVHGIHSFGLTTSQTGTETCCDESSLTPSRRVLPGFVVGAGVQFVDDFGIRFVPEIRYTRWMGRTFDTNPARSRTDQLELGFSVTF